MLLSTILQDKAVVYDPAITGLTGGGATKLDGVVTVGVPDGQLRAVYVSEGILYFYRLKTGSLPESSPAVIRPDDYDTDNQRIWTIISTCVLSLFADSLTINSLLTLGEETLFSIHDTARQELLAALKITNQPMVIESGTTRTLNVTDEGKVIICTNASGCTITLPVAGLGDGFNCGIISPANDSTLAIGTGGVANGEAGSKTATIPQGYAACSLLYHSSIDWIATGNVGTFA